MPTTAAALFVAVLLIASLASGARCALAARRLPRGAGTWLALALLLAVVVAGGALRYRLVPPHHAMYLDEPWYAEAACALARSGTATLCATHWGGRSCSAYEKAIGWPVVLAPWVLLAGCGTAAGIALNRILGTATILLVALATRAAGGRWWQAVLAAGLLAIHPTHIAWSATGETNVPAAAALLAGACGALRFLRRGDTAAAVLAVSALGVATAIRPESLLGALVIAVVVGVAAPPPRPRRQRAAVAIALVSAIAAASALPLWSMNAALSGGTFLAPATIARSLQRLAAGPEARVHALALAAAAAGAALGARRQGSAVALLFGTGIVMSGVVLAYDRFDARMLLAATVVLLPLAAGAAGRGPARPGRGAIAGTAVLGLIAWFWAPALRAAAQVSEMQRLETRLAAAAPAVPLPEGALVIAPQPPVLAANGTPPPMALSTAFRDPDRLDQAVAAGAPVYFLCDMFCEHGFADGSAAACDAMLARFTFTPVLEETIPGRTYGLYRVSPLAAGATRPPCPRPIPYAPAPATAVAPLHHRADRQQ
jgi:hypothetical protein